MADRSSVPEMMRQSRTVLTSPSVATFERFERAGSLGDAVVYVGLAAAITGVFGLAEGLGGFVRNVVATVLGFLIFVYLVQWIAGQRGGTGTLDEVAYTFSLFWTPLSVLISLATLLLIVTSVGILLIPVVTVAGLALNVWFAYLATRASTNLEAGGRTWGVLLLAALGAFLVNLVVGALLG